MGVVLVFAFISGLVTIVAPCIWPLLPIVLSSSALGGHRRPIGLTIGILLSFGSITLSVSYFVALFHFDPNILRVIAVIVLLFLGATLVIPSLTQLFEGLISRFAGRFGSNNTGKGFVQGFVAGLALGVVWAPCAGPILATIATLAATRAVGFQIILVTISYLIGVGIPLFIFSYAGQKIVQESRIFNKYTLLVQRIFGVIIILTALLIFTNYDKVLEVKLLNLFPSYSNFITAFESNSSVQKELGNIKGQKDNLIGKPFNPMPSPESKDNLFNANYKAPELTGISKWLNSDPLKISGLHGKVVLVDFWTYTCINCIRTLPHVTSWYEKYKDDGFVVIGVHTPEFEFEHSTSNVQQAIKQYNINYPVPQDNDYATWNAFNNRYWPAEYLIDKDGVIRRVHFGEGEYDQMEMAIRNLLQETGQKITGNLSNMPDQTPSGVLSPETYLGFSRMEFYFPNGQVSKGDYKNLKISPNIPVNSFTLGGNWQIMDEYSVSGSNASLEYNFFADHVYLVMAPPQSGSAPEGIRSGVVKVFIDGKVVDAINAGADVKNGSVTIDSDRLYDLIDLHNNPGQHLLRLEFSPEIQVFAFTFG